MHGLEIEEEFPTLVGQLFVDLKGMLLETLPSPMAQLINAFFPYTRNDVERMVLTWLEENEVEKDSSKQLDKIRQLIPNHADLSALPYDQIMEKIVEHIGPEDSFFEAQAKSMKNSVEEQKLAWGFGMLNLIGYYADDFRKVTKKKDRFRSSQNDYRHLIYARHSGYLVTRGCAISDEGKSNLLMVGDQYTCHDNYRISGVVYRAFLQ